MGSASGGGRYRLAQQLFDAQLQRHAGAGWREELAAHRGASAALGAARQDERVDTRPSQARPRGAACTGLPRADVWRAKKGSVWSGKTASGVRWASDLRATPNDELSPALRDAPSCRSDEVRPTWLATRAGVGRQGAVSCHEWESWRVWHANRSQAGGWR
jgi:hypothetical protein